MLWRRSTHVPHTKFALIDERTPLRWALKRSMLHSNFRSGIHSKFLSLTSLSSYHNCAASTLNKASSGILSVHQKFLQIEGQIRATIHCNKAVCEISCVCVTFGATKLVPVPFFPISESSPSVFSISWSLIFLALPRRVFLSDGSAMLPMLWEV